MTDADAVHVAHPHCPWCSAELPSAAAATCPSCGATLIGETETPVPGLTTIDPEAVVRGTRPVTPERRSKLLSWITGEEGDDEEAPAPPGSLEPPPPEVQREMLRMELEAEVADLQAEADALAAAAREEGLREDEEALTAVADDAAAAREDVSALDVTGEEAPATVAPTGDPAAEPATHPPAADLRTSDRSTGEAGPTA